MIVQQGHTYFYQGKKVVALLPGAMNTVVLVLTDRPQSWVIRSVRTYRLRPAPMRYFGGAIPK